MLLSWLLLILNLSFNQTFFLKDIDSHRIPFSSLKGQWIVINYWASWCEPCLHEIKELNHVYRHYKTSNVILFGVNAEGLPRFEQKKLIQQYNIDYPSLVEDPATYLNLGEIQGVPITFIFNPMGTLEATLYGQVTFRQLSRYLNHTSRGHNR